LARITIRAAGKINLFLDVLGKRGDGYHDIVTVMQEIDLHDTITISEQGTRGIYLMPGPGKKNKLPCLETGPKNLACRAAKLFMEGSGIKKGISIRLEKRIPAGAGLRGGSSDAAAVLKGLNKLWKAGFSDSDLAKMGARIGMDVPFFIRGGTALATGRGDVVTPVLSRARFWVILVDPGFSFSTRSAYESLDRRNLPAKGFSRVKIVLDCLRTGNVGRLADNLYNIFEKAVDMKYKGYIKGVKEMLETTGAAGTLMTGSGSVVYGIYNERGEAQRAYRIAGKRAGSAHLAATRGGLRNGDN